MKITKKEVEILRSVLKKIEDDQVKEKMRINGRRKLQKQGKSLNKGKVKKQTRPLRSKKIIRKKK